MGEEEQHDNRYYREYGNMYYTDSHGVSHPSANMTTGAQGRRGYQESGYPIEIRDYREGRSPVLRKTYMERKMYSTNKDVQM